MKIELVTIAQLPWINHGLIYRILDLPAGISYNITGDHNRARHADYVCASVEDARKKLLTSPTGNFNHAISENWNARPCILTIIDANGNERHFAAATHNVSHAPDMPQIMRSGRLVGRNPVDARVM